MPAFRSGAFFAQSLAGRSVNSFARSRSRSFGNFSLEMPESTSITVQTSEAQLLRQHRMRV
jgi:hypothetical protein